jgi:hypothetical protein
MTKLLTAAHLRKLRACREQVKWFEELWPKGLHSDEVTPEDLTRRQFDLTWVCDYLLTAPALAEYEKTRAAAWAEYEKTRAAALAEYEKTRAPAREEYEKTRAAAWAECEKAKALALATAINKHGWKKI